jgi:hypothetical protein
VTQRRSSILHTVCTRDRSNANLQVPASGLNVTGRVLLAGDAAGADSGAAVGSLVTAMVLAGAQ